MQYFQWNHFTYRIGPNTPYHSSISGIGGPWDTWDPTFTYTGLAPGIYEIILADDESFDIGPPLDPGGFSIQSL
ncbi:MAG: hypothetical protein IPN13_14890 [Bacteroidetes bacterium]|nr:hypothetical protein [Bacteroidota bacterium]